VRAALEAGVTYFDTARAYMGGRNGISGVRSASDAPGIRQLLESLAASGGDPALEGTW